jgi:BirA family biotin operon repressor/biotin-[acetyl-CoA-carboxylase] ligase
MTVDVLDGDEIKRGLPTLIVGQNVAYFASIDSTNTRAKELARAGAPDGTLVIAESQTGGRGRLSRQWLARPGTSLLMSLILHPPLAPTQAARTTMICSLGLADAIEAVTPLRVRLKWPNDLLINGRKIGGILTEVGLRGNVLDFTVVGIGLNVNVDFGSESIAHTPDRAPDTSQASLAALIGTGTSLRTELGHDVSRTGVLRQFLINVEARYQALRGGWEPVQDWSHRLETLGRLVTVTDANETTTGWAEGVDEDGALLVRQLDGQVIVVHAGDVSLRSPTASI